MRQFILVATALALLAPAATALDLKTDDVTSKWLVGFHSTPTQNVGDLYFGEKIVAVDTDLDFIVIETVNPDGVRVKTLADPNARYLEPDASDHSLQLTPNDPLWTNSAHYGMKKIRADVAWDKTLGASSAKIGMVDSGIKATHEDFAGRIVAQFDFYNNDATADDSNYCANHGSHTAGTAGAATNNGKGVAGAAQGGLVIAKIFQGKNPGPTGCSTTNTAIVNALKYVADQGAVVSSNSWGGGSANTAISDAISYALGKGTTVVGAAGNSGSCTNCVGEPWKGNGGKAGVIVVSCTDANDAFCSFSSQGPQVDVAAPGNSVLSVDGKGTNTYKTLSGTSMSTPHVSGTVALVKSLNGAFTPGDVETRIKSTAVNLGMISDRQGAGRLDAGAAVY